MQEEKPKYNIINASENKLKLGDLIKVTSIPVLIASLCCLSPVILLSLGVVSLSVASELANVFYGTYKWAFRAVGLIALIVAFVFYLRRQGVCTIDEARKRRNEILNKLALTLIVAVIGYIFFLYVVVEYIGKFLNVWN
jgi:amino acid transporter